MSNTPRKRRAAEPRERFRLRRALCFTRSITTPEPPPPFIDPELIEALEEKLAILSGENAQLRELATRQKADFDNFRKRTLKDKEQARISAREDVVAKLLLVLDNFDRALASANQVTDAGQLREGVEMVSAQLMKILREEGLERIEALNQPFDPAAHEAIAVEERDDVQENVVCEVMLPGYKLNERVVRPAMVKVAKAPQRNGAEQAGIEEVS